MLIKHYINYQEKIIKNPFFSYELENDFLIITYENKTQQYNVKYLSSMDITIKPNLFPFHGFDYLNHYRFCFKFNIMRQNLYKEPIDIYLEISSFIKIAFCQETNIYNIECSFYDFPYLILKFSELKLNPSIGYDDAYLFGRYKISDNYIVHSLNNNYYFLLCLKALKIKLYKFLIYKILRFIKIEF